MTGIQSRSVPLSWEKNDPWVIIANAGGVGCGRLYSTVARYRTAMLIYTTWRAKFEPLSYFGICWWQVSCFCFYTLTTLQIHLDFGGKGVRLDLQTVNWAFTALDSGSSWGELPCCSTTPWDKIVLVGRPLACCLPPWWKRGCFLVLCLMSYSWWRAF